MITDMPSPDVVHFIEVDGVRVRSFAVLTPQSIQDDMLGTQIPIFPGRDVFVGRDEGTCSPFIQSNIVSRVHFRIYSVIYDDDLMADYPPLVYCEDRQSSNGTYVNDTLIGTYNSPRSPYLLNDGDVISIRPHWTFHFHQTKQANGRNLDNLQIQEIQLFSDRYTISSRLLGSGIYGSVYLANDVVTQKQVACKIVDLRRKAVEPDGHDTPINSAPSTEVHAFAEQEKGVTEVRKKLIREIEILSKLSHPNIATLYKAFRTPHSLYIFNELATGGDLFSFLQANGSCLEDLHARIISRQIAIAVEYLHSNGIAHRDLKPENVLVMRTGIGNRIVLTDFGCAGYIGGSSGRMMSTVGTYDYVAPEVHRPQGNGYTEAIDLWSLGVITLCLLTGDAFISFEELKDMTQAGIALKLAGAQYDYPQWRNLNLQGKDFIKKLLVLEPQKRMTAKEAVNHDWFRKPERIAVELDKLYERSIIFWSKRSNHAGIVEDLPNVVRPKKAQSDKVNDVHQNSALKRIPNAASPYFGLERHLQPRGTRSRSNLDSQRQKILAELKESDSQFIITNGQPEQGSVAKNAKPENPFPLQGKQLVIDMTNSMASILRSMVPNSTGTATTMSLAAQSRLPTDSELGQRPTTITKGPESEDLDTNGEISANRSQRRQSSPETSLGIRQVDANDLFGTIPIEIKAAEAAEAAHAAYDDLFQSFLDEGDEETEEGTAEGSVRPLARSYTLSQDDREMHDEAAKELPRLSTAKAFSEAIAKRKQLKDSSGGQSAQRSMGG